MKETLLTALGMLLCNIGIPEEKVVRWLRLDAEEPDPMKKLDVRSDKKRLQDLLGMDTYANKVTMIMFDHFNEKWVIWFETKEAMEPWSHLTHWAGYPLEKSIKKVVAL
jgi:hypothetical protein